MCKGILDKKKSILVVYISAMNCDTLPYVYAGLNNVKICLNFTNETQN